MVENLSVLLVGALFGASLDLAGFGSPRRLNDQFLLRDFSMFKVMFGAIVLSASLYVLAQRLGFFPAPVALVPTLDLGVLVGGFVLGAGLVIGGYCPGTALAGAAGGRVDALLFFAMMYPGYRFWLWLQPLVRLDFHAALAPRYQTLPELLGAPDILVLIGLGAACLLGWKMGDRLESRSAFKAVSRSA
jgi:uncharacterized membrane protein YedE/YeeE